ncbi:MAG: hypothetical protein R3C49_13790 [Planctomycetaceae bacterium]
MSADASWTYRQLHEFLQQLDDAQRLLAHGPKRIAAGEAKIAAAEQACAAQKDEIQRLKKAADASSLNLKSREAEVSKQMLRLNDAKTNKEYEIVQGQIAAARKAKEALEDEVLGMLTDVDSATAKLKQLQTELENAKQNLVTIKADVQQKEPGLKADAERLETEIKAAESVIPGGEPRSTYKRLKGAMSSSALAPLEETYCSECNTEATPQDVVRMNMAEFVLCRACGRILYQSN